MELPLLFFLRKQRQQQADQQRRGDRNECEFERVEHGSPESFVLHHGYEIIQTDEFDRISDDIHQHESQEKGFEQRVIIEQKKSAPHSAARTNTA